MNLICHNIKSYDTLAMEYIYNSGFWPNSSKEMPCIGLWPNTTEENTCTSFDRSPSEYTTAFIFNVICIIGPILGSIPLCTKEFHRALFEVETYYNCGLKQLYSVSQIIDLASQSLPNWRLFCFSYVLFIF